MDIMDTTEFKVVKTIDRDFDEYPYKRRTTITEIKGTLANKLREKHHLDGRVLMTEIGEACGYSEYTPEWEWEAFLTIGNKEVPIYNFAQSPLEVRFTANEMIKYLLSV